MRIVKCVALCIAIMLLCLLCSCEKEGENDLNVNISPSDKSLIDLSSMIYEKKQLLEIVNSDGSINELNAQYPIECIRTHGDIYRVTYLGNSNIAVLYFDSDAKKLWGKVHNVHKLKNEFDELTKGISVEEVMAFDPFGEYLFLNTGRNDTPKRSYHYSKDGYLITIEYNDMNAVVSINAEFL